MMNKLQKIKKELKSNEHVIIYTHHHWFTGRIERIGKNQVTLVQETKKGSRRKTTSYINRIDMTCVEVVRC